MPAWISAFTGLAGLVLGFFGLPILLNSPTANTRVPPAVAAPSTTTDAPTTTPPPSGTPPPTPTATPASTPSASAGRPSDVFRTLSVELADDYGFDLDDDPIRPVSRDADKEIYEYAGEFRSDQGAQFVPLKRQESGTYATCSSVTRFQDAVETYGMGKGSRFCVISSTGLVALAEYVEGSREGPYITLKLTIWKGTY
ncbi:hypothetical protein [Streptomyces sp. NPDC056480]|uniref:hypothetical protein n=1 Tax=Streptomyces sp. NPDC056480 TaxID=3345833 RepID=UPI0036BB84A3